VDRMHRQRVVKRAREKGEGGREAAGVRKRGMSCPQQKRLEVFKYVNRRVGRVRCSTHVFTLSVPQDMFSLQSLRIPIIFCVYGCQASVKVIIMNSLNVLLQNIWCLSPYIISRKI